MAALDASEAMLDGSDRQVIHAAGLALPGRGILSPAWLRIDGHIIHIVGSARPAPDTHEYGCLECPTTLLMPALVNTHTHLDLTHIGPRPYAGDFVQWIEMIRHQRAGDHAQAVSSVQRGAELSLAGGTGLVGDIAGPAGLTVQGIAGVSFVEAFGIADRQHAGIDTLRRAVRDMESSTSGMRIGLQPHAPYSCGPDVYAFAAGQRLPLATHLAETLEELEFVRHATGPLADMLGRFGVRTDTLQPTGQHPIDWLSSVLSRASWLLAHLNYLEDRHLPLLAQWPVSVAYCPRASAYFGHPYRGHPPHRYRELLAAGVNVTLGTDSIVCLDTPDRISILDEMRLLYRRDATDPSVLLQMATLNGARALGFDTQLVSAEVGATLGLIGVELEDPNAPPDQWLGQVLMSDSPPHWVTGPFDVSGT